MVLYLKLGHPKVNSSDFPKPPTQDVRTTLQYFPSTHRPGPLEGWQGCCSSNTDVSVRICWVQMCSFNSQSQASLSSFLLHFQLLERSIPVPEVTHFSQALEAENRKAPHQMIAYFDRVGRKAGVFWQLWMESYVAQKTFTRVSQYENGTKMSCPWILLGHTLHGEKTHHFSIPPTFIWLGSSRACQLNIWVFGLFKLGGVPKFPPSKERSTWESQCESLNFDPHCTSWLSSGNKKHFHHTLLGYPPTAGILKYVLQPTVSGFPITVETNFQDRFRGSCGQAHNWSQELNNMGFKPSVSNFLFDLGKSLSRPGFYWSQ